METRPLLNFGGFRLLVALLLSTLLLQVASQAPPPPPEENPAETPGGAPPPATPSTSWGGCVDPVRGNQPVVIGQPTTICLVLSSDPNWSTAVDYMRLSFSPIADDYSRFRVPQSFQNLVGTPNTNLNKIFPGNITVHAESQTALSFQKLYYGEDTVYPALTAVIAVNEGKVTGITWDDGCVFCAVDECEPNTYNYNGGLATPEEAQQPVGSCPVAVNVCKLSEKAECDLILYVVWTGTDANGRDFTSSANRFSAFPKQAWSDRLSLALPDWMDNLNPFGGSDETN